MLESGSLPIPHVRVLPPDEWERLKTFGPFVQSGVLPNPEHATVLVAELDGAIVGCWMRTTIHILEGLYIAEPYRKQHGITKRLFFGMLQVLRQQKVPTVITLTQDHKVAVLAAQAGFVELPGWLQLLELSKQPEGTQ